MLDGVELGDELSANSWHSRLTRIPRCRTGRVFRTRRSATSNTQQRTPGHGISQRMLKLSMSALSWAAGRWASSLSAHVVKRFLEMVMLAANLMTRGFTIDRDH